MKYDKYYFGVLFVIAGIYLMPLLGCASDSLTDRSGFSAIDHYNFGLNWLDSNKLQNAEKSFLNAIELDDAFGDAYIQLGLIYYVLYEREANINSNRESISKYYNQAYNCFQSGIRFSPKNPLGYAGMARLQIINRQIDGAIVNLLKAGDLTKPDDISTDIIIYYELGNCYLAQGKYKQAIAEYENYLQLVPMGVEYDNVESLIKELEKQIDSTSPD